jgi:hypothetical protein
LPDPIFYAAAQDPRVKSGIKITGYVPSRFLMRNGAYVRDPIPGASQKVYLYSDSSGQNKTDGKIANPNNYIVVPASYSEQEAKDSGAALAETLRTKGLRPMLEQMTSAFWPGGSEEMQRNPRWGIPPDSFVPAYISGASDHFGYVTGAASLPRELAEFGGGIHNLFSKSLLKPNVNASGKFGLSLVNEANIAQGHAAGRSANSPPSPFNDYGRNTSPPAEGQIGEGKGIAPFSASLAGINPDESAPAAWPPQQNSPVRYLGSRVQY